MCGVAVGDEVFLVHVGADAGLPLVAAVAELHDLHGGFALREDRAFDHELAADGAGALTEDRLKRVVVAKHDRDDGRNRHAGEVDDDRLAAPRLADDPAGIAEHRESRNPWRGQSFAFAVSVGSKKLHGRTEREVRHASASWLSRISVTNDRPASPPHSAHAIRPADG